VAEGDAGDKLFFVQWHDRGPYGTLTVAAFCFRPMSLALVGGPSSGDGHGGISLDDFELLGLKEPPSQTAFPAHLAADRATGEVLHDLAIVRIR
jgi:hypothetical protein